MRQNIIFILFIFLISCSQDLRKGAFEIHEGTKKVTNLYRDGNYQIDYDLETKTIIPIKNIWLNNNEVLLKGMDNPKSHIDTITFKVIYTLLEKNKYTLEAKAQFMDSLDYVYKATMVKTSNEIPEKFQKKLDSLNFNN